MLMVMACGKAPDKQTLDISRLDPVDVTVLLLLLFRVEMSVEGSQAKIPRHQESV